MSRFRALDSWRGISALMIAVYHFKPNWGGYLAVDFFFVLSGFVLTHTYLCREVPIPKWTLTVRRLVRLYPYHLVTLLAFVVFQITIRGGLPIYPDGALATFIQHLTLTQNIGLSTSGLTMSRCFMLS